MNLDSRGGIGSALNVPFYGAKVESLYAADPSLNFRRLARRRVEASGATFDCAVTTWTLCTIPSAARALKERKRVDTQNRPVVTARRARIAVHAYGWRKPLW